MAIKYPHVSDAVFKIRSKALWEAAVAVDVPFHEVRIIFMFAAMGWLLTVLHVVSVQSYLAQPPEVQHASTHSRATCKEQLHSTPHKQFIVEMLGCACIHLNLRSGMIGWLRLSLAN